MQNQLDIDSLSPVIRVLSSLDTGRAHFSWEIYVLLLGREGKDGEIFLYLLFLNCFQLKIINIPKWHILGWHILVPFLLVYLLITYLTCIDSLILSLFHYKTSLESLQTPHRQRTSQCQFFFFFFFHSCVHSSQNNTGAHCTGLCTSSFFTPVSLTNMISNFSPSKIGSYENYCLQQSSFNIFIFA